MKRLFFLPVIALTFCAAASAATFKADPVHSTALFRVQHLGAGYTYGVFAGVSGTLEFDAAKPEESSIEVLISVSNLDTFNEARDKHLLSSDFFDVEQHPEMTFKSTAWKAVDENTFEITGDFTLHGVTKSITVTAEHTGTGKGRKGDTLVGFETTFEINRSEYGMGNMVPAVGDAVRITVALEAIQS